MKYRFAILIILSVLFFQSCSDEIKSTEIVSDLESLHLAIKNAKPGYKIIMANGVWKDVRINFKGHGTKENPITLRTENDG
jgi:poly(beta-D-mannuronate) lyase